MRTFAGSDSPQSVVGTLRFRYPWRDYQARVLDAMQLHLADRRLHVVAAPGSGKTTLGLELFRRLGRATVVLSPTRVIRDQWIDRLRDFCSADSVFPPPWTSRSLDEPGFLTSITYQALHTKYRGELEPIETDDAAAKRDEAEIRTFAIDEEETLAFVQTLRQAGVRVLILDEAHHLRAEWWKALTQVVEAIEGMTVVSLTATPPYESHVAEWKRYEELCGTIDEEISVPELVKAGTLCPHQDFVWTVVPTEYEKQYVTQYYDDVRTSIAEFRQDDILEHAVVNNRWIVDPTPREREINGEPELAIALLVFLRTKGLELSVELLNLLDLKKTDIPAISDYWWQQLLDGFLNGETGWAESEELAAHRRQLKRTLRDRKLLRRNKLYLSDAYLVKRHMTQSSAKVQACVDIYGYERNVRGGGLRQVILTDYIRDEQLGTADDRLIELGAWPVFKALASQLNDQERRTCALLTGRLVIVHASLAALLPDDAKLRDFEPLDGFAELDRSSCKTVAVLTALLESGDIHVLVGTRALLGEGWDAPCINSLVLASSVGSYMLTNQMRGRAIRVDKRNPGKVSSIWHLVAVVLDRKLVDLIIEPDIFYPGLADFFELNQRFRTFVGVDQTEPRIENDLLRLRLPFVSRGRNPVTGAHYMKLQKVYFQSAWALEGTNRAMVDRLYDLEALGEHWDVAIASAEMGCVVPTVSPDKAPTARPFHFGRTLFYFLFMAITAFLTAASVVSKLVNTPIGAIAAIAFVWSLPKFFRAARLLIRHFPVDGTIHQMGLAVRDTLCATGLIENSASRLRVQSRLISTDVYVNLAGGSFHEMSLFADCMEEILGPIQNPRYLLIRHGKMLGFRRKDYHAVPMRIAAKKQYATVFLQAWKKYVGEAELVYTRTAETRRFLLQARAKAFSAGAARAARRTDRWV